MNRNEITLQEMFSSVIGELREGGRWGTAHIYQSAVNAFSAFTKWQPNRNPNPFKNSHYFKAWNYEGKNENRKTGGSFQ